MPQIKNLDFIILPKGGNKLVQVHYDPTTSKLVPSDFGVSVSPPMHVFAEDDKSNNVIIVDTIEFKELAFKAEGETINKTLHAIPLQTVLPVGAGPFLPYFNAKTMLLYVLFPNTGDYVILKYKKKKFTNMASGKAPLQGMNVFGIVGTSKPDAGHVIYFYN